MARTELSKVLHDERIDEADPGYAEMLQALVAQPKGGNSDNE